MEHPCIPLDFQAPLSQAVSVRIRAARCTSQGNWSSGRGFLPLTARQKRIAHLWSRKSVPCIHPSHEKALL